MSKHHLVIIANFARDNGMSLTQTIEYIGNNYDELPNELTNAYEDTYAELMQFVETQIA
jgi:S-methylmethionine-dependent homocysteine/selenocysteine methylase